MGLEIMRVKTSDKTMRSNFYAPPVYTLAHIILLLRFFYTTVTNVKGRFQIFCYEVNRILISKVAFLV